MTKKKYIIEAKVWRYTVEPASWYFVYVDKGDSEEIKKRATKHVGFRFVPITAILGQTTWKTTLFPTKEGPYLLCLKADVRRKEDVADGDLVTVTFTLN